MRLHALALLLALEGVASAQRSGGTIGGGGGWSSSSSGGGHSSVGMGIPSSGSHGGSSGADSWPGLLVLVGACVFLGAVVRASPPTRAKPPTWRRRDVRLATIRVAVDHAHRNTLLPALRDLAHGTDPTTQLGRAELVHEVALLLRRAAPGWLYASTDATEPLRKTDARHELTTRVAAERARFDVDWIRNYDGAITEHATPSTPTVHGLAVVSIMVATKGEGGLDDTTAIDRTTLHDALAWLGNILPEDLIAADFIWTPAHRHEPLDSIALEARFGDDLTRLPHATAGTVICSHCNGRYSAEAGRCATCGSPYLGRAVA